MIKYFLKKKLSELRPLPMGRLEFEEWSDRVIKAAQIPGATIESQKFALAEMLLHLGPRQDFESDVYFAKQLRAGAVKQVGHTRMCEIKEAHKAKQVEDLNAKAKQVEVLADKSV